MKKIAMIAAAMSLMASSAFARRGADDNVGGATWFAHESLEHSMRLLTDAERADVTATSLQTVDATHATVILTLGSGTDVSFACEQITETSHRGTTTHLDVLCVRN